jgi:hypothetical protein
VDWARQQSAGGTHLPERHLPVLGTDVMNLPPHHP